jgi:tetratricopeptide (TPR) repeat protein
MLRGLCRHTLWNVAPIGAVLSCFGLVALGRIDGFVLLEPDSADYVIMAESLARDGEYRAPYDPTATPYSWRPPGLSILLMPVALALPHSIAACKAAVLLFSMLGILLIYGIVREISGCRAGLFAAAVFASNPSTLLWSTEVVTEPAYVAATLLLLGPLSLRNRHGSKAMLISGLVLGATPLIRTVGLSLTLAMLLWLVHSRRFRELLLLSTLALAPYLGWMAFRPPGEHESYAGFVTDQLSDLGFRNTVIRIATGSIQNLTHILRVIIPGGMPGVPVYSLTTRFPSTVPSGAEWLAVGIGCAFLTVCGIGLFYRRHESGGLAMLYLAAYTVCLGFWPSRDERFLWPLLAPLLLFLPAGSQVVVSRMGSRDPRAARFIRTSFLGLGGLLIVWQLVVSLGMATTSYMCHAAGNETATTALPNYFADWEKAGLWLAEHSAPFERVITTNSSLFCTSRRFQQSILVGPSGLNRKIRDLPARYVAFPDGPFDSQASRSWMFGDWTYQILPVYRNRGVIIGEVLPNRSGTLFRNQPDPRDLVNAATEQIQREPWRFDLYAARASLLEMSGHPERALVDWRYLVGIGRGTHRAYLALAASAFGDHDYALALRRANAAAAQAGSEIDQQVQLLWELSLRGTNGEYTEEAETANVVGQSMWLATERRFEEAEVALDRLVASHPRSGTAMFGRGEFRQRTGRVALARVDFERARALGDPGAEAKLVLLESVGALSSWNAARFSVGGRVIEVDPESPACHARIAQLLTEDGVPGQALDLLERAVNRLGSRNELLFPLAKLYCYYALPQKAARLYETVLEREPNNLEGRLGLHRCAELRRLP